MTRARLTLAVFVVFVVLGAAGPVGADDLTDARAHYEKARAAYALGRYADAATEFESAFALKPDPAILYNAAQAYRLAGKKERALELYRSYRRVYGRRADHAQDVEKHIAELEKAIEGDRHASQAESTDLAPIEGVSVPPRSAMPPPRLTQPLPAAPPPAAGAPTGAAPPAALVTQPAAPPAREGDDKPIYTRWWFWAGTGAVVAATVVTIVLLSRKPVDCGPGVDYCANTGL